MTTKKFLLKKCRLMPLIFALTGCAIGQYPGQPGVKTNGSATLDKEILDDDGLWIYETTYDNSEKGDGVTSVVTKLFENVYTYSSNARSNGHGTFYKHKLPYNGSKIQSIYLPKLDELIIPPESKVVIILGLELSETEIDDRNISEENIFNRLSPLSSKALQSLQSNFEILKAGELGKSGSLLYKIKDIILKDKKYSFEEIPTINTSIFQNGLTIDLDQNEKKELKNWFESEFPGGYKGAVKVVLKNDKVISKYISINTLETLKKSGKKITIDNQIMDTYNKLLKQNNTEK